MKSNLTHNSKECPPSLFRTTKHPMLNEDDSASQTQPVKKRNKIKIACENCRTKKKKCDGNKPICSTCKSNYDKKLIGKFKNKSDFKNLPMIECKYRLEESNSIENIFFTNKPELQEINKAKKLTAEISMNRIYGTSFEENNSEFFEPYESANINIPDSELALTPSINMASNLDIPFNIPPINFSNSKTDNMILPESTGTRITEFSSECTAKNEQSLISSMNNTNSERLIEEPKVNMNIDQILAFLKERNDKYHDPTIKSILSNLYDIKFNPEYMPGYWDRSIERILRWPIFEGKYEKSNFEIKKTMKEKNRITLNEKKILRESLAENNDDKYNIESLNSYDKVDYVKLEEIIFENLLSWVDDFIMNVHTSGNLFIDINLLRSTCSSLIDSYIIFKADSYESETTNNKPHVFFLSNTIKLKNKNNRVIEKCSNYDTELELDESEVMPNYIILIIISISLMSRKYDVENPRISNFKSSLEERKHHSKDKLAFRIYKLAEEIFDNDDTSGCYSIWKIQYKLLLSMFKNYFLKPIEAWNHIFDASSSMIMFLELNRNENKPMNSQLIQRIYWQCYKNECELKFYLSPMFMSSGILTYKPPFKVKDLKIPSSINEEPLVVKDGWAYYLTEIFIRPILNRIMNQFYGISNSQSEINKNSSNSTSIEKNWQLMSQNDYIKLIQSYIKDTGKLLLIFEKFLIQQKLSTPLRCADERVIRIKECLFIPLLYHISTVVPLPLPNYSTQDQSQTRPIDYQRYLSGYLISFIKDICEQYLKIPDLVEFSSERRHGSWFRLRDIFLSCILLMIVYKKFGIFFFEKKRLKKLINQTNIIYNYWRAECIEFEHLVDVMNSIYADLPYITDN